MVQEDVFNASLDCRGGKSLGAQRRMGIKGGHDGFDKGFVEVRGVGELFFGVVGGLFAEGFGFEELGFDDVVDVDELVLVGGVAAEEFVELFDDLLELGKGEDYDYDYE